jgi:hypothetical protein
MTHVTETSPHPRTAPPPQADAARVAGIPALLRVAMLAGAILGASLAAHLVVEGLGGRIDSGNARIVVILAALIALSVAVLLEQRAPADCGLALPDRWPGTLLRGLAAGAATWGGWIWLCAATGAMRVGVPTGDGFVNVVAIPPVALLVSLGQQILLSGWVLAVVRERHGTAAAVIVTAVLAPLLHRMQRPLDLGAGGLDLDVGLALAQVALALTRLITGHVLTAGALLAGARMVERVFEEPDVLVPAAESTLVSWLAPQGDFHRAPVVWAGLLVAIALLAVRLARQGPASAPRGTIPLSLKRVYPFAMPLSLAPLHVHARCLARARWRVGPVYLPRLAAMVVLSAVNEVLCLPERLLRPLLARRTVPPPLFVLGVHRSGTTHLHNLLALDPELIAPRNRHTLNPLGAIAFGWPMAALLAAFMPWRRPMDSMAFHLVTTSEEEYAIANLCPLSPYWGLAFPEQGAEYDRYLFPEGFAADEKATWQRAMTTFLGSLVFWSGRRPVLKNPCNTGRLPMLLELYPDARIVHIHRHPHDVYRSNMHLTREAHILSQLQDPPPGGGYSARFLENYVAMEEAFYRDAARLPAGRLVDVRFDDLERDPAGQIARIYDTLGLPMTPRFEGRLRRHLARVAGYRRNRFAPLPAEERARVNAAVGGLLRRWGWSEDG